MNLTTTTHYPLKTTPPIPSQPTPHHTMSSKNKQATMGGGTKEETPPQPKKKCQQPISQTPRLNASLPNECYLCSRWMNPSAAAPPSKKSKPFCSPKPPPYSLASLTSLYHTQTTPPSLLLPRRLSRRPRKHRHSLNLIQPTPNSLLVMLPPQSRLMIHKGSLPKRIRRRRLGQYSTRSDRSLLLLSRLRLLSLSKVLGERVRTRRHGLHLLLSGLPWRLGLER